MQFSEVFKYLCKEAGVTQRQALAEMKLGRNSAQRWTDSWPSFEALSKISNYFSVSIDTLSAWMLDDDLSEEDFLPEDPKRIGKEDAKKPADQKASGLHATDYDKLTPENKRTIDALIEQLLKAQSVD